MQALVLTLRFHQGRYLGQGDWPPAPGRLFQALVAGAARGRHIDARDWAALAWFEQLGPPEIAAPVLRTGPDVITFVPNNDTDQVLRDAPMPNDKSDKVTLSKIRTAKRVASQFFDHTQPVLYKWPVPALSEQIAALQDIALRLYRLGQGQDMAWAVADLFDLDTAARMFDDHPGLIHRPGGPGDVPVPGPGTLDALCRHYRATLDRLQVSGSGEAAQATVRLQSRAAMPGVAYREALKTFVFDMKSGDVFHSVEASEGGPLVARLIARAAERLGEAWPDRGAEIERFLVGRGAGAADVARRVRVYGLPSIGHAHVDRAIRRVVVEVPQSCPLRADAVARAFAGLSPLAQADDPGAGEVLAPHRVRAEDDAGAGPHSGQRQQPPQLVRADDDAMLEKYLIPARVWRSETPLALGTARRRIAAPTPEPKAGAERAAEEAAAAAALAAALRHAGIAARPLRVAVQREPFAAQGTRAEAFAPGTRFSPHALWHAEIAFAEPLPGPLILGDGRFLGLGLMGPQTEAPGIVALAIRDGLMAPDPAALAHALRRAVMARARDGLSRFFSGHEPDGAVPRDGRHRHLACVADLARGRLLLVPPHVLEHRAPAREEADDLKRLDDLARDFTNLRAGAAGALTLARVEIEADDPLLAPARTWVSQTPYRLTRHPKRQSFAEALAEDIARETARRNLPLPQVDLLARAPGHLSAQVRLRFAVAQPGPLLLGQSLHQGGGLFVGIPPQRQTEGRR